MAFETANGSRTRLNTKQPTAFLPPINKEALENLRKNADLLILEKGNETSKGSNFHNRKTSMTERSSLLKKLNEYQDNN